MIGNPKNTQIDPGRVHGAGREFAQCATGATLMALLLSCANANNRGHVVTKTDPNLKSLESEVSNDDTANRVEEADVGRWMIVNDGVMGGRSTSSMQSLVNRSEFRGLVSPENGGGFASIRAALRKKPEVDLRSVAIRVRGDGKRYQFRVRTNESWDGTAYKYTFPTSSGQWQEIVMPLRGFEASFRGRRVPNASPLRSQDIRQIGFLIADGQYGEFKLEFADIRMY